MTLFLTDQRKAKPAPPHPHPPAASWEVSSEHHHLLCRGPRGLAHFQPRQSQTPRLLFPCSEPQVPGHNVSWQKRSGEGPCCNQVFLEAFLEFSSTQYCTHGNLDSQSKTVFWPGGWEKRGAHLGQGELQDTARGGREAVFTEVHSLGYGGACSWEEIQDHQIGKRAEEGGLSGFHRGQGAIEAPER